MARRKAAAQVAPQTLTEATALLARYSAIASAIAEMEQVLETTIAELKAVTSTDLAPFESELKDLFLQLKPWWAVASADMTDGKRKSIELGGCIIGTRTSTPKVKVAGAEDEVIAELIDLGMDEMVRVKSSLEKPAILRALTDGDIDGALLTWLGLSKTQREEFFIDRLPPKPAAVEIVPDAEDVA